MTINSKREKRGSIREVARSKKKLPKLSCFAITALLLSAIGTPADESNSKSTAKSSAPGERAEIKEPTSEQNFAEPVWRVSFMLGPALDLRNSPGHPDHDFAVSSFQVDSVIGGTVGEPHWYRGNWRFGGEFLMSLQISSKEGYVFGLLPVVIYNVDTATSWSPYFEAGAGAAVSDIGLPDLGSTFEFIEHAGIGMRWQARPGVALRAGFRVMHISNAGIREPNIGITVGNFLLGAEWSF